MSTLANRSDLYSSTRRHARHYFSVVESNWDRHESDNTIVLSIPRHTLMVSTG